MKFKKKYLLTLIPIEIIALYIFHENVMDIMINAWDSGKIIGHQLFGG